MIDVLHPGNTELSQRFAHIANQQSKLQTAASEDHLQSNEVQEDEEAAWLEDIQAAGTVSTIKGLECDSLVMDMSQLRVEPPTSAPRKSTKGKLPA